MKKLAFALVLLLTVGGALALTLGPITSDQLTEASEDPVFYNELGYMLAQEGKMVQAQAAFEQAVELDASYENARKNLYVAAFTNEDYVTAIAHARILADAHDTAKYHFDLAQGLVAWARNQATDVDEAVAALEEAIMHLEAAGDYPHAQENLMIVENVLVEALA